MKIPKTQYVNPFMSLTVHCPIFNPTSFTAQLLLHYSLHELNKATPYIHNTQSCNFKVKQAEVNTYIIIPLPYIQSTHLFVTSHFETQKTMTAITDERPQHPKCVGRTSENVYLFTNQSNPD